MKTRSDPTLLMSLKRTANTFILCLAAILTGCTGDTYQHKHAYTPDIMPEEVYVATVFRKGYKPNIAFCAFEAPTYARSTGEKAAKLLYSETLKKSINAKFTYIEQPITGNTDTLADFARENRFEFIIGGKVLHYIDGGISTASCAEQEISVYRLAGHRLKTVGHAKALEEVAPVPSTDYVFFLEMGQPAPSAESLMKKNAEKFASLLDYMFPTD